MLDQTQLSGDDTEPQSDGSTEIKVLHSGLRKTWKASDSRRDQKSGSELRFQQRGWGSDQQSKVNDPPNEDLKPVVENDPKACLKPAKTRTLESGLGSDLKLECGLDPGSVSEEIVNITPEPELLSDLRIESPAESDVVDPVAENLQPESSPTQITNLGCEKGLPGTTVLHPIMRSNVTAGSESNLISPLQTQQTQEPETLSKSKQRPGPFSLTEENLTPDPGSYHRIKSDVRSNPKSFLQSSKTLRSGSKLGDKNLKSESNRNKIRNNQCETGDCKTILLQSGFKLNPLLDPSGEGKGDPQSATRSEQLNAQTGLDSKSPESQPEPHQEEKPASRPKEASPVDTGLCRAEPGSQVRIPGDQPAGRNVRPAGGWNPGMFDASHQGEDAALSELNRKQEMNFNPTNQHCGTDTDTDR